MRGRPPKPSKLKIAEGAQPCRLNPAEPEPESGRPPFPLFLDGDDVARQAWDEIVPVVEALGVLTKADGPALGLYCSAYSRLVEAKRQMRYEGVVGTTDLGSPKPNPAANVAKEAEAAMLRVLTHFGLSPATRSRVTTNAKPEDDELAELMRRAQARRAQA